MSDNDESAASPEEYEKEEKKRMMDELVKKQHAAQIKKEGRALIAWAKILLKQRDLTASHISHFSDGVLLINLLEIGFTQRLGRYNLTPKLSMQKHDNVNTALTFMNTKEIKTPSIDSQQVVDGVEKAVVVLLWNTMQKLVDKSMGQRGIKAEGGQREKIQSYVSSELGVVVEDMGKSWRDGSLLCQLVAKLCPGKLDVSRIASMDVASRVQLAQDVAEAHLGIPPIFDAQEFAAGKVSDDLFLQYITLLLAAANALKQLQQTDKVEKGVDVDQMRRDMLEMAKRMEDEKRRFREMEEKMRLEAEQRKKEQAEREAKRLAEKGPESESDAEIGRLRILSEEQATRIRELEMQLLQMKELEKNCHGEKEKLLALLQAAEAENARQASEIYALHRDLQDLLARAREDAAQKEQDQKEKTDGGAVRAQAAHRNAYRRAAIDKDGYPDYIGIMRDHEAHLLRRRPNAIQNSKRFKPLYFKLTGSQLQYFENNTKSKMKGFFDLNKYQYAQESSSAEDSFTFKLVPFKGQKANLVVELRHLAGEDNDNDQIIKNWFYEVNRRIAMIQYVNSVKKGEQVGCLELLDFCMDDGQTSLEIRDAKMEGFPPALRTLRRAIMTRPNLRTIYLRNVDIDDKTLETIAEIAHHTATVNRLELPKNKFTSLGLDILTASLALNKSITLLDLGYNRLGDEGVKKLAAVLPECPRIKKLGLTGNDISAKGVQALCKGLFKSGDVNGRTHVMASIHLNNNKIGDEGCGYLADLCKKNSTVTELHLEKNNITDKGAEVLSDIISVGSKSEVTKIMLADNMLSSKGAMALAEALKKSYFALTVDLSNNPLIGRTAIEAFTSPDINLDWISLKVRSQTSGIQAVNAPTRPSAGPLGI